jgi:hypothetical protein
MPVDEVQVDTVFIRRRDAFISSALKAFLKTLPAPPVQAQAAE